MANAMKSTKGAMGHLLKHYCREKDKDGNYVKFGNQDIDPSRTHLNYEMGTNKTSHDKLEFIHKRLGEVKHLNRKDINVMCSWVITLPDNVPKEREKEFFELTYQYLCHRYGEENCIGCSVHYDENRPHMHFHFVPVQRCTDKDGNEFEKLNAKAVVSRKDLQTFHKDLSAVLNAVMKFRPNILKDGITKELGNQSIDELKRTTYSLKYLANELGTVTSKKSLFRKGEVTVKEEDVEKLLKADGVVKLAEEVCKQATAVQLKAQNELDRVRGMEDELKKVKAENEALKGSNKALKNERATVDTVKAEKSVLEGKLVAKDEEIKKLKADLKLEKLKNDNLTRSQADHEQVTKLLDDTIKEREQLIQDNEQLMEMCRENGLLPRGLGRSR